MNLLNSNLYISGGGPGPTGLPGLTQASQLLDVLKSNSYNQPLG